jgi:cyclopropane fatty-acyl-phospholipid synthase-like methyltransferase
VTEHQVRPPVPSIKYDETYFLTACEGHQEFLESEGAHLSRRLNQAFELAHVAAGMRILDIGCGRGEILLHCARLGAEAYGIDYAQAAVRLSRQVADGHQTGGKIGVYRSDAKHLPFPAGFFERVLMFDIVEHLHPWELHQALLEVRRVLTPDGRLIVHTAPNRWYDQFAYPVVRLVRRLMGQGERYPRDPRALNVAINTDVHVNEQDMVSLRRTLKKAGFESKVWLDTPPQNRDEGPILAAARYVAFNWPPLCWFFEREVFAVASKV